MDKIRELSKRLKILESNMKILTEPELITSTVNRCFHAEVECACNCGKHGVVRVEKFWERTGNCVCKHFHKPPKKPCGCLSIEEIRSIDGYSNILKTKWPSDDGNMLQRVPGLFSFKCNQGFDKFELYRRGNLIIKLSGKTIKTEKIIAEIPYESLLARFGVSP